MSARGIVVALILLSSAAGAESALAQSSQRFVGVNLSEPYSSTSFGVEGGWSSNNALWSFWGFGSALTVGERASDAWLVESLATRALGSRGFRSHVLLTAGVQLTGASQSPTEFAVPVYVGARVPLVRGASWDLELEAHIGRARRQAAGAVTFGRVNRVNLILGLGRLRLSVGHDDAAGPSRSLYGGAGRVSLGWRMR